MHLNWSGTNILVGRFAHATSVGFGFIGRGTGCNAGVRQLRVGMEGNESKFSRQDRQEHLEEEEGHFDYILFPRRRPGGKGG